MGTIEDPFGLRGRVAVVCGGAKGIGLGAAELFARAGATVVIADRDRSALEEAAAAVGAIESGALAIPTDVSVKEQVDDLAAQVVASHGKIDIWANVAGILQFGPIVETTEEDLDRIIGINLKGVYWGSAAAARVMVPAGRGSIINIASAGGEVPAPGISGLQLDQGCRAHVHAHLGGRGRALGSAGQFGGARLRETPMTAVHFTNADGTVDQIGAGEFWTPAPGRRPSASRVRTRGHRLRHALPGLGRLTFHDGTNAAPQWRGPYGLSRQKM